MPKTVVITGASSGIGRDVAAMFARCGDTVYDLSRTEKPQEGVSHVYCDVTLRPTILQAFETISQKHSCIDILILCAGIGMAGSVEHITAEDMHRQFEVNTFGPISVIQSALPLLRASKESQTIRRIVFVSSMAAAFGIPFQAMYSATKAAVNSLAFSLSNELYAQGISVTVVMPGDVKTDFQRKTNLAGTDVYPHMQDAISQMEHDEANGLSLQSVARKVFRAATRKKVALFYTSDLKSDMECLLQRLVPTRFALYVVRKMYHC